ncbi:23198_t:CDS:2, partial [Dentiscutata erythropus]
MRTYNTPKADEVAIIYGYEKLHSAYNSLQYPILFPFGEYGWHKGILRANVQQKAIKQNKNEDINIQEEFLKIIEEEEIVNQFEKDEEDQIANQVATNIIKDFNSNLTAEIQQKEIIEVDDFSKTMTVEFDNLLQRSSGLSGVFDDIALKSSTSMSINKLSKEKIIEKEIESQTELKKDNIESQTESEKDDNNS